MNKKISLLRYISGGSATLFVTVLFAIGFPVNLFAHDACIKVEIRDDGNSCVMDDMVYWQPTNPGNVQYWVNDNPSKCPADMVWVGGTNAWIEGKMFTKKTCGGDRYQLFTVSRSPSWMDKDLLFVPPATLSGYFESEVFSVPTSGHLQNPHAGFMTLYFREYAKYTINYDFDDGNSRPPWTTPNWLQVNSQVNETAPQIPGYVCVGWKNGTNSFPNTGGSEGNCSIQNTLLLSDKNTPNAITWDYRKASFLTTNVRSPGPGASALIGPYTDSTRTLRVNGLVTASVHPNVTVDGTNRWHLTGSTATGSLGDEPTSVSERTFDLQTETVIEWQYQKQALRPPPMQNRLRLALKKSPD